MTLDEALALQEGDHICSPLTPVPWRPIRVTELWVNSKRTIVRLRLNSLAPGEWVDAGGFSLPPEGKIWDSGFRDWCSRSEFRKRRGTAGLPHAKKMAAE